MKNEVFEREITKPPVLRMSWRTDTQLNSHHARHTSFNSVKIINAHYFALQVDLATHSSSNFFLLWGYKLSWNYLSFWWPHSATSYAKALLISFIWMYLHNIYLTNILYSAFFSGCFCLTFLNPWYVLKKGNCIT